MRLFNEYLLSVALGYAGGWGSCHRILKVQWREILTTGRSPRCMKVGVDTELKGVG